MKELSIFVDESGDFGEYDYHAQNFLLNRKFLLSKNWYRGNSIKSPLELSHWAFILWNIFDKV